MRENAEQRPEVTVVKHLMCERGHGHPDQRADEGRGRWDHPPELRRQSSGSDVAGTDDDRPDQQHETDDAQGAPFDQGGEVVVVRLLHRRRRGGTERQPRARGPAAEDVAGAEQVVFLREELLPS